ncbi:YadA-like family protein [Streptobacillus moniliformis]|uniref:YadA-like family protein n=1 Tax=Streptobacillus moniliformis TaxID=34105 RepID=UPI0007E32025|nr:YadA-like family protein [Streptobacillus moniliformis]
MKGESKLKKWLKGRIRIDKRIIIAFLITGSILSNLSYSRETYEEDPTETQKGVDLTDGFHRGNSAKLDYDPKKVPRILDNKVPGNTLDTTKKRGTGVALGAFSHAGKGGVALGSHSSSGGAVFGVGIGFQARATKASAIAIGAGSYSNGYYSQAYGRSATALGNESIAQGVTSLAKEKGSIAIGTNATSSGENAIAIGSSARIRNALYQTDQSKRTDASGKNSVALGHMSQASIENGIAIGSESKTTVDKGIEGYNPNSSDTETLKGNVLKSTHAALAIGNGSTVTRQITGLAAGKEDTDAVNVAQLKALEKKITNLSDDTINKWKEKLTIGYKVGSETNSKTVSLSTGLHFKSSNDNLTITSGDKGEVKFELKQTDTINGTNGSSSNKLTTEKAVKSYVQEQIKDVKEGKFKDLTITSKDDSSKKSTIETDKDGDLAVKKGDNGSSSKILTEANVGEKAKLKYKANGSGEKEVELNKGLNFKDGTNTKATIGENGEVKYDLNDNLTGIKSIKGLESRTTDKDDYGTSDNEGRAATEGAVKKLKEEIESKLGDSSKDDQSAKNKNGSAGKDGLNGKSINEKINSIRRGESGSLVYTDEEGNRVVKADDGKFYKKEDVETNGKAKANATAVTNIRQSLVDKDGSTTNPTVLGNVGAATKDTDAINLKQLKDLGLDPTAQNKKPALTYDGENKEKITLGKDTSNPTTITNLKEGEVSSTSKDAVNGKQLHELGEKSLIFGAEEGTNFIRNNNQTKTVEIISTKEEIKKDGNTYVGNNLTTKISSNGNKATISVGLKEDPEFKELTIKDYFNKERIRFRTEYDKGVIDFLNNEGVIRGLADPVDENDAANKNYVDNSVTKALGGVASAIAMANLPNVSGGGHNIAGSYGYYNGEHAFALGLSGTNEKVNLTYKASGSLNTRGNISLGAGLGYQFDNISKRNKELLTLQRNGNINLLDEKVYELEKQLNKVEKLNLEYKNEVEELKVKVNKLEKMLNELIKK